MAETLEEEEEETDNELRRDPIELAGLFEGDIDLRSVALKSDGLYRNAIRDPAKKWPNAKIPYVISSKFGSKERSVIARAMKTYHQKTCIRFLPRTSQAAYIHLVKGTGCSSTIGRAGGRQTVSLGPGCVATGQSGQ